MSDNDGRRRGPVSKEVVSEADTTIVIPPDPRTEIVHETAQEPATIIHSGAPRTQTLVFTETAPAITTISETLVFTAGGTPTTVLVTPTPFTSVFTSDDGSEVTRVFNTKPTFTVLTVGGTATTQVQIAFVTLGPEVSPNSSSSQYPSQSSSPSQHPNQAARPTRDVPVGAIVGAVLGCLLFVSLCVGGLFILRRRAQRRHDGPRALGLRTESALVELPVTALPHPLIQVLHDDEKRRPLRLSAAFPTAGGTARGTGQTSDLTLADEVQALRRQLQRMELERAMAWGDSDELPPPQYAPAG